MFSMAQTDKPVVSIFIAFNLGFKCMGVSFPQIHGSLAEASGSGSATTISEAVSD